MNIKLFFRDVWIPFTFCTLNLVSQQAGGLKILQGFQVEIFDDVYSNSSRPRYTNILFALSFNITSSQVQGSNFDFWASVWICFVRLLAAILAAKYIKNFGYEIQLLS